MKPENRRAWGRRLRSPSRADFMLFAYWGVLLLLLLGFAELAGDIHEQDHIDFDTALLVWLAQNQHPLVTCIARGLDLLGKVYVTVPLLLLLGGILWRVQWRSCVFFVLGVGGAATLNLVAKAFFDRARPDLAEALSTATNSSFPSGHTMYATALALAAFFLVRQHAPAWQTPVAVLGAAYALAAGVARAYLQVHYPSDVLTGWALAIAWVSGVNLWYGRSRRYQRYRRRRILGEASGIDASKGMDS